MAASSAAMTATGVRAAGWATSVPMVLATEVLMKAPRKLSTAAMRMATAGGSTRVETLVATALAVSWKPLVKSKAAATRIVSTRKARLPPVAEAAPVAARGGAHMTLGILQQHPIHHVGEVFAAINGA